MNQALKQRLVGTLVLGCLAIIFIPLLLDGEGISPAAIDTVAPPAPELSREDLPLPERPVIDADRLAETAIAPDAAVTSADTAPDSEDAAEALTPPEPLDSPDLDAPAADTAEAAQSPAAAQTATAATSSIALPVPADRVEAGAATADTTPSRDASGLPAAWTVRLGVFSNPGNADKLRACLIASGYKAYSRQQQGDSGSMTRVFVGPVATRAEATALGNQLKGKCELGENGIPVQYTAQ